MKKLSFVLGLLVSAVAGQADGLRENLVPENTRWLLHLDAEAFAKTKVGAMMIGEKLEPHVEKVEDDAKLDLSFSFKKITALTAFGSKLGGDKDGVLLVQTTADVRSDLEKLIAFREKTGGSEPAISRVTSNGVEFYSVGADLNVMPASEKVWLIGKDRASLREAREVVLGKADPLKGPDFLNYPAITNAYFFLAIAQTGGSELALPAQAQILKKAEGGRIVIGEKASKLFLNLALRSKDEGTVKQLHHILQGLLAFVALTQTDNKDLAALANSASVSAAQDIVSVNLSFPVERAIQRVREEK